jgi:hypothetical protein
MQTPCTLRASYEGTTKGDTLVQVFLLNKCVILEYSQDQFSVHPFDQFDWKRGTSHECGRAIGLYLNLDSNTIIPIAMAVSKLAEFEEKYQNTVADFHERSSSYSYSLSISDDTEDASRSIDGATSSAGTTTSSSEEVSRRPPTLQ